MGIRVMPLPVVRKPRTAAPVADVLRRFSEPPRKASISAQQSATGGMLCIVPPPAVADTLADIAAMHSGELPTELHLTLAHYKSFPQGAYLGELFSFVAKQSALPGMINGIARFSSDAEEGDPIVALVDVPGLTDFRHGLLQYAPAGWSDNHGFTAHITLAYIPANTETPLTLQRMTPMPIVFDALWVWAGGERLRLPFGQH